MGADIFSSDRIESLEEFNVLQGLSLTVEEAEHLAGLQREFLVSALNDGFSSLAKIEQGEFPSDSFEEHIVDIKAILTKLRSPEGSIHTQTDEFLAYYQQIHSDEVLDDRQKLFLEFLVGLGCTDVNIRIAIETAKLMLRQDFDGNFSADNLLEIVLLNVDEQVDEVIGGVKTAADEAFKLGNLMHQIFEGRAEEYWKKVADALKSNPELEATARKILSMRHIPEDPEILGAAQALHWSGWGGDGSFFELIDQLNDVRLKRHKIGWRGDARADHGYEHFSSRMALFGEIITKLKEREGQNVKEALFNSFPDEVVFDVFDAGAGNRCNGSANWIGRELQEQGRAMNITAGEVDGRSLAELASLKGKTPPFPGLNSLVKIVDAKRLDLNFDWDAAPSDEYHAFVTSIVLHQIMDPERGEGRAAEIIKMATKMTKTNGVIAWSDVGEEAVIQSQMLTFNVADREGAVCRNIYQRVSYYDTRVATEKRVGIQFYKVPIRLSRYEYATPESVADAYGAGIYQSNIYKIVEVPEWLIDRLEGIKEDSEACEDLIEDYFAGRIEAELSTEIVTMREQAHGAIMDLLGD